jgi:serine/threonine protein kinase
MNLINSVLFSTAAKTWKITDFGLTYEGTSKQIVRDARGTRGYRAPELVDAIQNGTHNYNRKVDMWSLGCIFYELIFNKKTFSSDWESTLVTFSFKRFSHLLSRQSSTSSGGVLRDSLMMVLEGCPGSPLPNSGLTHD